MEKMIQILFWIVSIALVAFEMVAGIGKVVNLKMANEWMAQLGVSQPFMSAFGGLEVGAAGVILYSLFNRGSFFDRLVPYAVLGLLVLKVVELILQYRGKAPSAAMVGPIVVIVLTIAFYFLR
jgi:hypothetical protein